MRYRELTTEERLAHRQRTIDNIASTVPSIYRDLLGGRPNATDEEIHARMDRIMEKFNLGVGNPRGSPDAIARVLGKREAGA